MRLPVVSGLAGLETALLSNNIFFWKSGQYDHSRWISIANRGANNCVLQLSDLCLPGKVSRFSSVTCPTSYLKSAIMRGGSLQLTLPAGFLLIQRHDEVLNMEFRGVDDLATTKASFKVADFAARIAELEEAGKVAVIV